jgi:hypothetical protein
MNTEYLPYISGVAFLLVGILFFLKSFKIYMPKNRTEEQIAKSEEWHNKFGPAMKFISILVILKGVFDLISSN